MRRGFRISCRQHRLRAVGRGTKKRNGNDDFSLYEGNELHRAPRTDYSPHYRNGSRLLASKGQDKGASSARPVARGIADLREFQLEHLKSTEETSMSAKQPSLRGTAWLAVLTMMAGVFFGGPAVLRAGARWQGVPEQEKDKKDEKKTDKKDEKKGLPLKSDRKIEFTTDEGTWLSLDVSLDAKTIAFELVGDLYTLPIEGGQAKLISGGMFFDSQPKFSPDGQWIAFISDRA